MIKTKTLLILTATLALTGGSAHAKSDEAKIIKPVIEMAQQDDFVYIPLNTHLRVEEVPQIEKEISEEFETVISTKIEYDLVEDIDADIGLLKTEDVNSKYGIESGALPRGRYFEPLDSKLGAGVSTKF